MESERPGVSLSSHHYYDNRIFHRAPAVRVVRRGNVYAARLLADYAARISSHQSASHRAGRGGGLAEPDGRSEAPSYPRGPGECAFVAAVRSTLSSLSPF